MALTQFAHSLPTLIVDIVGLAVSLANRGKRPQAAMAGIIGFSGLILLNLGGIAFSMVVSKAIVSGGRSYQTWGMIQGIVGFVSTLLAAALMGVIIYGMFYADKRKKEPSLFTPQTK